MAIDKLILNGNKNLEDGEFDKAVENFGSALKENPKAFKALVGKATALQRLKKMDEAFEALEAANNVAKERANRQQLGIIYFRYFLFYYANNELQAAIEYLNAAKKYSFEENQVQLWFIKLQKKADKLGFKELDWEAMLDVNSKPSSAGSWSKLPAKRHTGKGIRLDMTQQGSDKVIVNIYIDRLPKDNESVNVNFTKESVSIDYPTKNSSKFQYEIDPLFAEIDPKSSNFLVNESTIQLVLIKVDHTIDWTQLEKKGEEEEGADLKTAQEPTKELDTKVAQASLNPPTANSTQLPSSTTEECKPAGYAYPSSAKNARDWSKFEVEDDDEQEGANNEDAFFKTLYASLDDDSKRAMMKSYVESNGTALSTDWSDVSKKKVEFSPPDGIEEVKNFRKKK